MSEKVVIVFQNEIPDLFEAISALIADARKRLATTVNAEVTLLNFKVGEYIHSFILEGSRAAYGKQIIANLSALLNLKFGSGWSAKHLFHCLRCAESFSQEQIVSAVNRQYYRTNV